MTEKKVVLTTEPGVPIPTIGAPCAVTVKKNGKLRWRNKLKDVDGGTNQGEVATVTLYEVKETGNVQIKAKDFCAGYSGDLLVIPAKSVYVCDVIFHGEFKYDVVAAGHQDLDPIIIVQPPPPNSFMLPGLAALVAAVVFFGIGHYFGYVRGSNQK